MSSIVHAVQLWVMQQWTVSIPISCLSSSGLNIEAAMKPRMEESFTIHLGVWHVVECRRTNHFTITALRKFPLFSYVHFSMARMWRCPV